MSSKIKNILINNSFEYELSGSLDDDEHDYLIRKGIGDDNRYIYWITYYSKNDGVVPYLRDAQGRYPSGQHYVRSISDEPIVVTDITSLNSLLDKLALHVQSLDGGSLIDLKLKDQVL